MLVTRPDVSQYGEEADVNTKDFDEYNDALETEAKDLFYQISGIIVKS